ncbi:MAG: group II intron maturase-specific domain-containing protein [Pirellulaceae bacterium]
MAKAKARETIRDLTSPHRCFLPVVQMIGAINSWSTGWTDYFSCGYPRMAFRSIHHFIVNRVTNHLRRRSQRAYRPPVVKSFYAHVHDLGLKRI